MGFCFGGVSMGSRYWFLAVVLCFNGWMSEESDAAERYGFPLNRRAPASRSVTSTTNEEWSPEDANYAIGFESASTFSIIGQNMAIFGMTLAPDVWLDLYLGYTKSANTTTTTSTVADNTVTGSRTDTLANTGVLNPHTISVGAAVRFAIFQNSWLQIHVGPMGALVLPNSVSYPTGSMVRTYADKDDTANYSVTDTVGAVDISNGMIFHAGARLGSEFYLRWFPHLAIGFNTGVLTSFGGNTTTTTTTRNKIYAVVNDAEQTATTDTNTVATADLDRGMRGATFGVGGTVFNLFGNFLIRYIW